MSATVSPPPVAYRLSQTPEEVRDVNGYIYPLRARIGQGGQGAVYEVVNGWMAAKLFPHGSDTSNSALRERLAMVRRLPIEDLPVARPIATLDSPHTGYVMRLATGMTPIANLMRPAPGDSSVRTWYLDSGGLRRRLLILQRFAQTIAELHSLGLTYGDPSPANFLVSTDSAATEVQLIDADNLRPIERASAIRLFTPGFGAPELVQDKSGNTFASDVWSLLAIAFQVLVLNHPFVGDYVDCGEPELEEAAFRGELPWIDDQHDPQNRARENVALPRAVVLSPRLQEIFQACFGAGRTNPTARPSAARVAAALAKASRMTVTCTKCVSAYYATAAACPWCATRRPPIVLVELRRWDGEADSPMHSGFGRAETLVLNPGIPHSLSSTVLGVDESDMDSGFACQLALTDQGVTIRPVDGREYHVRSPDGLIEKKVPGSGVVFPVPTAGEASWRLHTGALTRTHIFCTLRLLSGGHATY